MHTKDLLAVGEVARRSGFAPSALRYYDSLGLISSTRTTGDQRRYERGVLRRLAFIRAARNVGLTLEEIAEALATLPQGRTPTKSDWNRLSRGWKDRINEQIQALETLRDSLESCIGCGCLSLRTCTFSNPDDEVASHGSGARYLPRRLRAADTA
ncbi:redox-sensitive transcriptional activator SoxR [Kibdelosporangium aridum]|uniref:MerR family transcriptional regulator, redox-sensitive transcriptional activator SoxR n=1 Tax=Kibdelosporangium aridum TaxID=2030 RepID=A0A1Y5XBL3_KIBAR|nr:redox-sensitive transcriptional activator SoxR [Kibdelosporangium aridum]SMC85237.1 MerR family transcriptional regulator, redox-sensitive transcriptional activator SoxR [Kibdelosporangium aridum]